MIRSSLDGVLGRGCVLDRVSNTRNSVLGMKANDVVTEFAQVEFTAVLATILTMYKVVPASQDDVSEEAASEGIRKLVAASSASMTVYFPEPEKLWVKLVKR